VSSRFCRTPKSATVNEPTDALIPGEDKQRHRDHETEDFADAESSKTLCSQGTDEKCGQRGEHEQSLHVRRVNLAIGDDIDARPVRRNAR
jgi:hypothetical protein